MAYERISYIAY